MKYHNLNANAPVFATALEFLEYISQGPGRGFSGGGEAFIHFVAGSADLTWKPETNNPQERSVLTARKYWQDKRNIQALYAFCRLTLFRAEGNVIQTALVLNLPILELEQAIDIIRQNFPTPPEEPTSQAAGDGRQIAWLTHEAPSPPTLAPARATPASPPEHAPQPAPAHQGEGFLKDRFSLTRQTPAPGRGW